MAEKILQFLTNLLKIGREQLFLKSELIRNKVPMKPVLGLTGLGVLFMAVRPLLTSTNENEDVSDSQIESTISGKGKLEPVNPYDVRKTLRLMREKELELKRQHDEETKLKS